MKIEIKVPAMGESISEATVSALLKQNGTEVQADSEIIELETDKLNQVLFAPQAGILTLNVAVGDIVKIGQVIGSIESDAKATVQPPEAKPDEVKQQEIKPKEVQPSNNDNKTSARVSIQEGVRQQAVRPQELKPDANNKPATSPAAPAEMPKVLTHGKEPKNNQISSRQETRKKMSKIRKIIAERLVQAQKQAAMLTTFNEVDMTEIMKLREKYKDAFTKEHGVKLGFMSFFVKAAVVALQEFQDVNSYIDGDEIVHREYYDIGIAVGTDRGLVVPVVRDCDHLSFSGIESAIENYAKKARTGGLTVDDLTGGGFTITNGGVYGSLLSTPILNLPQSAILGMHKIMKRAVVVDDQIVIRPMMYLALSYDHRIVDGKEAVSFLVTIKNMLEDPTRLLLEV